MLRRMIPGGLLLAAIALAAAAQAAEAMVFGCMPLRAKGEYKSEHKSENKDEQQIEAYIDGFVPGGWPPSKIESIRVLARLGADVYEFFPEHVKQIELSGGTLRVHLLQPLSAGAFAEMRIEGGIAAEKGGEAPMQVWLRNERREARGGVRCTIE